MMHINNSPVTPAPERERETERGDKQSDTISEDKKPSRGRSRRREDEVEDDNMSSTNGIEDVNLKINWRP